VIYSGKFDLYSPQATLFEVAKHLPWLANRLHVSELAVFQTFQLLPIVACQPETYDLEVKQATELVGKRDPLDVPLLALALARRYMVWSDDRDFEGIAEIQLFKTSELLARIQS
jgi:predicted nucleic acid-binding protein